MQKSRPNVLSVYVPAKQQGEKLVDRLAKLAEKRDRSVNYLAVEAITQYVEKAEEKGRKQP